MSNALPDAWVERIFARILVRYGAAWVRMWEGVDMAAVRADWADELAGMQNRPEAIAYGLRYLPQDRPPTVQAFKAQCNRLPEKDVPSLPSPPADPKVVAAVKQAITETPSDPRAWARRLKRRHEAGERLNMAQVGMYREALRDA